MHAHSLRDKNQILHGNQTGCEEKFYTIDHECWCVIYLQYEWLVPVIEMLMWIVAFIEFKNKK